jgi:anaerobic magnesium-protoporphyrin IX monomethyl ester cyclase
MKKVLLVNSNTETAPYPVPPLGLCLVAGRISRSYEVRLFDGQASGGDDLAEILASFAPDYVGVGVRNIDDVVMAAPAYYVDSIAEAFIRPIRSYGRAPLILGGAGFSVFPRELLALYGAQYGIVGEGEEAFDALLHALDKGGDPLAVPGVVAGDDAAAARPPESRRGGLELPDSRIDAHVDYAPYRDRGSYPVQTKRGCAHECVYCAYPRIEGTAYRLRDPAAVVDEIGAIGARLGDVSVEIVDSTFNDPAGHAEAICAEIVRRGLEVRLRTMGVNPAGVTDELVSLMRCAGFAQIDCTPDSGSPRVLAALRKNFDRPRLERAARAIAACGMPTMWFFILGGPGETRDTIRETFDFVDRFVRPEDMVHVTTGVRIYPGTALAARALDEGIVEPGRSLLRPTFYVSPALGREALEAAVAEEIGKRPNCVPAAETTADPEMIREAMALREKEGLEEPMFRSLLRARRARFRSPRSPS